MYQWKRKASFVNGFINYNMKVKYRLSTDSDQKKKKIPEDIYIMVVIW